MTNAAFAAIDIGSNSTNLLIVDADGVELVREVNVTALGEGLAATGVLTAAAMSRTLAVITQYSALVREHAAQLAITGTAACRMAANTADFFAQVHSIIGVHPRLLSTSDEARLAWQGAVASLPPIDGVTMVVDIGGASTELTIGDTRWWCRGAQQRVAAVWRGDPHRSRVAQRPASRRRTRQCHFDHG